MYRAALVAERTPALQAAVCFIADMECHGYLYPLTSNMLVSGQTKLSKWNSLFRKRQMAHVPSNGSIGHAPYICCLHKILRTGFPAFGTPGALLSPLQCCQLTRILLACQLSAQNRSDA